ncbi:Glycosyltransferase Family 4 [Paenibacillus sp. UNC496MF]|uniref:glycosyltransferase family 4 protein n=1 Tax=Paenibacillus sp. UNC496MF TaxID=1502753 RepID=UPI0008EB0D46|nr:glycosyltransferase family 1 protein [Paenibacillus sp. UNC496MF]SFI88489.1 Glycosyltransferase Family 4 [Paenibacillus sp. UNC496MF]
MGAFHINSLFLSDQPTGLGVYTREILKRSIEFVNLNQFNVLLTKNQTIELMGIERKKEITPHIALNPLIRPMYLNRISTEFMYSLTHHGRTSKRGRQIITIHDLIPLKFPKQYKSQYYYYKYILPKTIAASDLIITISEHTKKDIIEQFNVREEKIKVIYNGYEHIVNENDVVEESTSGKPYLLMVGATYAHKNIHTVLQAYAKIKDKTELNAIIVGKSSEYFDEIKKLSSDLGIENRVQFLGYVSNKELSDLYRNARIFIYPSLYEGFGLPILEAMHYGTPTIAANASVIPEIAADATVYIDPLNTEDIADAILLLNHDSALREKMIRIGKENVKRFTWDNAAADIKELLQSYV